MTIFNKNGLGAAVLALGLLAVPVANAGSLPLSTDNFATNIQKQLDTQSTSEQAFIYKFLLDMGARANGTKKEAPGGDHAAWCAKVYKTYDPASNTFAAFNGKRYTCHSPY
jgi:hypothetical protein